MSDPRRFSAGFLQEIGYLDAGLQRTKCPRVASPVPFAGPDLDGAEEPAKAFAELRRRAEMATKEAAEAVAAAALALEPTVADSEDYGSGLLPLPLHPELGGSGPYQTVWRRSTTVNEFGMALFVPKPEPSSAHGGSGRYLLKVGIDPPTPERFPQLDRSED